MTHFLSVQSSSLSAEGTQVSLHLCSMLRCLLGAHDKQGGRNWGNRCSVKEDKQKAPFRLFKHRFPLLSELSLLNPTHAGNTSTYLSTHEVPTPLSLQMGAETKHLPDKCSHRMLEVRSLLAPVHAWMLLLAFPPFIYV